MKALYILTQQESKTAEPSTELKSCIMRNERDDIVPSPVAHKCTAICIIGSYILVGWIFALVEWDKWAYRIMVGYLLTRNTQ